MAKTNSISEKYSVPGFLPKWIYLAFSLIIFIFVMISLANIIITENEVKTTISETKLEKINFFVIVYFILVIIALLIPLFLAILYSLFGIGKLKKNFASDISITCLLIIFIFGLINKFNFGYRLIQGSYPIPHLIGFLLIVGTISWAVIGVILALTIKKN